MDKTTRFGFRNVAIAAAATVLAAGVTATSLFSADEIELGIDGGRVTLVATDAPLAEVLAAWSRVGNTRFVGAEAIGGERVTLRLTNAPEAEAIRLVLRAAAGYVAAPRRADDPGSSRYDRVTVLAARTTPAGTPAPTPAPGRTDASGDAAGPGAAASPGLLPMDDLQRLLDATAGRPARARSDSEATPYVPVVTALPGIGAGDLLPATDRDGRD